MYEDYASFVSLISNDGETSCYHETMELYESPNWKLEMTEEMYALE